MNEAHNLRCPLVTSLLTLDDLCRYVYIRTGITLCIPGTAGTRAESGDGELIRDKILYSPLY